MARRIQIAVIGGGQCSAEVEKLAARVGAGIAAAGAVLVCGGLGGVMAASARAAREAAGLVVGLLPGYEPKCANPGVEIVIPTGLGHARNVLVVAAGDAVIALPGEHGTASEVSLALTLGRPVVGLGAWGSTPGVMAAGTVEEAVRLALTNASRG